MDRLEAALAEPPRRDTDQWCRSLRQLTDESSDEFANHIRGTEGPGGLFEEVIDRAPRLSNHVDRLRADHPRIQARIAELGEALRDGSPDPAAVEQIRRLGSALLIELIGHRQRGADLLYEAYWVDVAPSD
jgi:hypothetical protein